MAFETPPIDMGIHDKKPTVNFTDAELVVLANQWFRDAEPFHSYLERIWQRNEEYYLGKQTEMERVPQFSSDAVQNQIFMGVETVVPIATANTPEFVASPANENELSAQYSDATEKVLKVVYEERSVRSKLEQAVRHMIIYRFGCLKPYWDEYIDDVNVKVVHPKRLWFARYGSSEDELPVIIEKIDMTIDEIESLWGAEVAKKVKQEAQEQPNDRDRVIRTVQIFEYTTNDFKFWKCGQYILNKQENPYFDFSSPSQDELGDGTENLARNHFARSRKEYIILSAFRIGNSVVGSTSLVEQTIPINDIINVTLRSMINSSQRMGNPAWFIDSAVMTREEASNQITNEPGLILHGTDAANPTKVRRDAPPPIPNYIINLLQHAQGAFDNIFGTHSTTRGERGNPETLGGRILLKQADLGRIDLLVREVERAVGELGNYFVQIMRMYYDKERTFRIYGENGVEFITFSRNMIEKGVQIVVKSGTTLPTDELTRRNEAIQLYQLGALDPLSLYEIMKLPNPEQTFLRLQQHQQGQLAQQVALKQQTGGQGTPTASPTINPLMSPPNEMNQARERMAQ